MAHKGGHKSLYRGDIDYSINIWRIFLSTKLTTFFVLNAAPFAALSTPPIKDALVVLFHDTVSCDVE